MRWLTILLTVLLVISGAQATAYYNSSNDFVYTNGSETLSSIHSDINNDEIFNKTGLTYTTPFLWISDSDILQVNASETLNVTVIANVPPGSLNVSGIVNVVMLPGADKVPPENFTTTINNTVHSDDINFSFDITDRYYSKVGGIYYNYTFDGKSEGQARGDSQIHIDSPESTFYSDNYANQTAIDASLTDPDGINYTDLFIDSFPNPLRIYQANEINRTWQNLSLIDDAVSYWTFDEGSGQAAYDSNYTSANNGTLGSTSGSDSADPTWVDTPQGKALSFDGIDDIVDCGNKDVFTAATMGTFTIGVWVKPNIGLGAGYDGVMGKEKEYVVYNHDGDWEFWILDSVNNVWRVVDVIGAVDVGVWQYIVATWDGTNQIIYKNGNQIGSNTPTMGGLGNTAYALTIGDKSAAGYNFNGTIDEVHIYNRALSQKEIQEIYNGTIADGQHSFNLSVQDDAGNKASKSTSYIIDSSPSDGVEFTEPVTSEGLFPYNFSFWDGAGNILKTGIYNTYKDNTSLYEGVDNVLYNNGTVSRPDTALSNNVSDTVSINTAEPEMVVRPTDIANHKYILENFTNTVEVEENGVSWNWLPGSSIDYVNVTKYSSGMEVTFYVSGTGTLDFNVSGMGMNQVFEKYVDGNKVKNVNTTLDGVLKDSVNLSVHKVSYVIIPYESPTPPSGGGGGYAGSTQATTAWNYTAISTIEVNEPFTVRLTVEKSDVIFDTSRGEVRFYRNGTYYGSYELYYLSGSGGEVTWQRNIKLPEPGTYTYHAVVYDEAGFAYTAPDREIAVVVPPETGGTAGGPLLVSFTDATPVSHSRLNLGDGVTVYAVARNVNGTLKAWLQWFDRRGAPVTNTTLKVTTTNETAERTIYGTSEIPRGYDYLQLSVVAEDNDTTAWASPRVYKIINETQETTAKKGGKVLEKALGGSESGSEKKPYGRWVGSALLLISIAVFGAYRGGYAVVAIPATVIMGVWLGVNGYLPTWVAFLILMAVAIAGAVKFIPVMLARRR